MHRFPSDHWSKRGLSPVSIAVGDHLGRVWYWISLIYFSDFCTYVSGAKNNFKNNILNWVVATCGSDISGMNLFSKWMKIVSQTILMGVWYDYFTVHIFDSLLNCAQMYSAISFVVHLLSPIVEINMVSAIHYSAGILHWNHRILKNIL